MPISDLCSKEMVTVDSNQSLQKAAKLMKKKHVGTLIVTQGESPVGIITDRDIVLKVVAEGKSVDECKVEEAMTDKLVTAPKDCSVYDAIRLMEKKKVRRLVVVDKSERLCGVLSTDDLVQMLSEEMAGIGRLYEKQIQTEPSQARNAQSH